MVETTSQPYEMPVRNEAGFVLLLPNVSESLELRQNPHPDPYAAGDEKLFPLGTKLVRGECVWRYCYNGDSILAIAAPLQSPAITHADTADDITVTTNAAIGDTTVYLTGSANHDTSPADEINEFAEGYLFVNDATGQGQCRKVKSNAGFGSSGATEFKLYEALTIALTAGTSECGLTRSPYWMVIAAQATMTGVPVGVPGIPVPVNDYFWAQTGGPCAVVPQEAITLSDVVIVGTTTGKVNDGTDNTTEMVIGYPLTAGAADTEEILVFLTLDS